MILSHAHDLDTHQPNGGSTVIPDVTSSPRATINLRRAALIATCFGVAAVVVLALPCELDDRGVPGPCSYAGLEGDGRFADAVLQRLAGSADAPAAVRSVLMAKRDPRLAPPGYGCFLRAEWEPRRCSTKGKGPLPITFFSNHFWSLARMSVL